MAKVIASAKARRSNPMILDGSSCYGEHRPELRISGQYPTLSHKCPKEPLEFHLAGAGPAEAVGDAVANLRSVPPSWRCPEMPQRPTLTGPTVQGRQGVGRVDYYCTTTVLLMYYYCTAIVLMGQVVPCTLGPYSH